MDHRIEPERQQHHRSHRIVHPQHRDRPVFHDQPFEPHHRERRRSDGAHDKQVTHQLLARSDGTAAAEDDQQRTAHSQHHAKNLHRRKPVDPEKERKNQHEDRAERRNDRRFDGTRMLHTDHQQQFFGDAHQQRRPDEFIDVVPVDFFDAAPKKRDQTEQSRYCNGKRRQRDRRDVMGHQYLVKRIVDRPHQIGQQQAEMGPGHVL